MYTEGETLYVNVRDSVHCEGICSMEECTLGVQIF